MMDPLNSIIEFETQNKEQPPSPKSRKGGEVKKGSHFRAIESEQHDDDDDDDDNDEDDNDTITTAPNTVITASSGTPDNLKFHSKPVRVGPPLIKPSSSSSSSKRARNSALMMTRGVLFQQLVSVAMSKQQFGGASGGASGGAGDFGGASGGAGDDEQQQDDSRLPRSCSISCLSDLPLTTAELNTATDTTDTATATTTNTTTTTTTTTTPEEVLPESELLQVQEQSRQEAHVAHQDLFRRIELLEFAYRDASHVRDDDYDDAAVNDDDDDDDGSNKMDPHAHVDPQHHYQQQELNRAVDLALETLATTTATTTTASSQESSNNNDDSLETFASAVPTFKRLQEENSLFQKDLQDSRARIDALEQNLIIIGTHHNNSSYSDATTTTTTTNMAKMKNNRSALIMVKAENERLLSSLKESRGNAHLLQDKLVNLEMSSNRTEVQLQAKLNEFKQKTGAARIEMTTAKQLMKSLSVEMHQVRRTDQANEAELCEARTRISVLREQLDHCLKEQQQQQQQKSGGLSSEQAFFRTKRLVKRIEEERVRVRLLELIKSRLLHVCHDLSEQTSREQQEQESLRLRIVELENAKACNEPQLQQQLEHQTEANEFLRVQMEQAKEELDRRDIDDQQLRNDCKSLLAHQGQLYGQLEQEHASTNEELKLLRQDHQALKDAYNDQTAQKKSAGIEIDTLQTANLALLDTKSQLEEENGKLNHDFSFLQDKVAALEKVLHLSELGNQTTQERLQKQIALAEKATRDTVKSTAVREAQAKDDKSTILRLEKDRRGLEREVRRLNDSVDRMILY